MAHLEGRTGRRRGGGFTLIEVTLVAAIIGVLAAIALPKFANMVLKAKQAELKARLGALRSAISIYYSDNEGLFPTVTNYMAPYSGLEPSLVGQWLFCLHDGGKYMGNFNCWVGEPVVPHFRSAKIGGSSLPVPAMFSDFNIAQWAWIYDSGTGQIIINCTHTALDGRIWSSI